jgi:hypothetical protein
MNEIKPHLFLPISSKKRFLMNPLLAVLNTPVPVELWIHTYPMVPWSHGHVSMENNFPFQFLILMHMKIIFFMLYRIASRTK